MASVGNPTQRPNLARRKDMHGRNADVRREVAEVLSVATRGTPRGSGPRDCDAETGNTIRGHRRLCEAQSGEQKSSPRRLRVVKFTEQSCEEIYRRGASRQLV